MELMNIIYFLSIIFFIGKLEIIPSNMKVIILPDGKSALQKKTRSRRRFKTSLKTRRKIAASARRFKLPLLTIGANLPWIGKFNEVFMATGGGFQGLRRGAEQALIPAFTGVRIGSTGNAQFSFSNFNMGLLPNLVVMGIKRTGILRGTNRAFSRLKLPVSLS